MRARLRDGLRRSALAAFAVVQSFTLAAPSPLAAQACPVDSARAAVVDAWERYAEALEDEVMELDASIWPSRVSKTAAARVELDHALLRAGAPAGRVDRIVDYAARVRDAVGSCVAQAE